MANIPVCTIKSTLLPLGNKKNPMKKRLLFLAVALFTVTTWAQTPVMKFAQDTLDYGTISPGSNGMKIFKLTNQGNAPLVISDVRSSCGCTVPKKPTAPIMPGKQGEIEVVYDTQRVGPIRKTIYVYSNAGAEPKQLYIVGQVDAPKQ